MNVSKVKWLLVYPVWVVWMFTASERPLAQAILFVATVTAFLILFDVARWYLRRQEQAAGHVERHP